MQAKHHMTKLIKSTSKLPSWKTLEDLSRYIKKNSEMFQDKQI